MSNTNPSARAFTTTPPADRVRVWDPVVRLFHWGLASAVLVAFITEDALLELHTWAGYTALVLIGVRVLWGFIGTHHARWSAFVRGPRATFAYLGEIGRGHPARYLGHNPAGGAMAVALIAGFAATAITGLVVLGASEFAGPFASYLGEVSSATAHDLKEAHEFIAWATLALVPLHLLGVVLASRQHHENLVLGMIDGYKRS